MSIYREYLCQFIENIYDNLSRIFMSTYRGYLWQFIENIYVNLSSIFLSIYRGYLCQFIEEVTVILIVFLSLYNSDWLFEKLRIHVHY